MRACRCALLRFIGIDKACLLPSPATHPPRWNDFAQLGNTTTSACTSCAARPGTSPPVAPLPGLNVSMVAAGALHTCAITSQGDMYCFGSAEFGQLGGGVANGTLADPQRVAGGLKFAAAAASSAHTCAIEAGTRAAWCWGESSGRVQGVEGGCRLLPPHAPSNSSCSLPSTGHGRGGELGDGSYASSQVPVKVSGGHLFVTISAGGGNSAGGTFSCGTTMEGVGLCWGEPVSALPTPTCMVPCRSALLLRRRALRRSAALKASTLRLVPLPA